MSSVAVSKSKVFVFGVTGRLGSQLLHFLTSSEHGSEQFEVTALVRADTVASSDEKKLSALQSLKKCGAHVVNGDIQISDAAEIAKWISGQDIVISAISSHVPGPSIELKLLEAVKLAKVPWFIPGVFSSDITKAAVDSVPPIAAKKGLLDAVAASGVNYFFVFNYLFSEYVINPLLGTDIVKGIIAAPRTFQDKTSTTTLANIAQLTVEALKQRNEPHVKNQYLHFVGDTVTYEQIAQLLEEHFKKPFKRVALTKDEAEAAVQADNAFKSFPARFALMFGEQKGIWIDKKDSWNAKYAKHIYTTTLKEYVAQLPL